MRRACQAGVSAHRLAPFGYCFELTDKAIAPGTGLKAFDYCFELTDKAIAPGTGLKAFDYCFELT